MKFLFFRVKTFEGNKYKNISKNKALQAIKKLAEKVKKQGDGKKIWHIRPEYMHLLSKEQLSSFQKEHSIVFPKVQEKPGKMNSRSKENIIKEVENPADPKYKKFYNRLQKLVSEEVNIQNTKILTFGDSSVSDYEDLVDILPKIKSWKESQKHDGKKCELLENPSELCIVARLTQDSSKPLEQLVKFIVNAMGGESLVSPSAVEERVLLTAQRKVYGVKGKQTSWEDTSSLHLWTWEVDNLDLLSEEHAKAVTKERKRYVCKFFSCVA